MYNMAEIDTPIKVVSTNETQVIRVKTSPDIRTAIVTSNYKYREHNSQ